MRALRGVSWWSVLWLTVVWVMLWGTVTPLDVVGGLLVAVVVLVVFPLPRVTSRLRVRPLALLVLVGRFLLDVVVSSFQVAWLAVRPGPVDPGVVMDLRLSGDDELLMTLVAEMVALVPGTVVIDLDPRSRVLTIHAIDVPDRRRAEQVRHRIRGQEARVLRALHPDPGSMLDPRRRRWSAAAVTAPVAGTTQEEER